MKICLPKDLANRFKQALKSGEINPEVISTMTSKERNAFFTKLVGEEYGQMTNALFESKLLLKNQKQGMISWAKSVAGLKEEARRDLLTKIEKMQNILTPENEGMFLEDLASTKLGVGITDKEAADIAKLTKEALDARDAMDSSPRRGVDDVPTPQELAYGEKTIALNNYVNNLKTKAERYTPLELVFSPRKAAMEIGGITKSVKSSGDISASLRQGIKTFFSNPIEWWRNAPKQFSDIKKVFQGKDAMDMLNAEIISDPMYDLMKKSKLAVGAIEEAFPTRNPEMIPFLGKFFKASDAAYSGFLHRMRVDLFKKYIRIAESQGININNKAEIESIAKMVNALTGRGHLGGLESSANALNVTFFSPRNFKSNLDFLTAHQAQKGVTPFVRMEAAKNLIKTLAGIGTVLATAQMLWGDDAVEWDPRSSDFGKIKIGKTRFDITGGNGSLITLLGRQITGETKTKGNIKSITTGKFGAPSRGSVLMNFTENKLSPLAQEIQDRLVGKTFEGNKPTLMNTAKNFFVPLGIANINETKDQKDRADLLLIGIMDALGVGSQTY